MPLAHNGAGRVVVASRHAPARYDILGDGERGGHNLLLPGWHWSLYGRPFNKISIHAYTRHRGMSRFRPAGIWVQITRHGFSGADLETAGNWLPENHERTRDMI
jgi:hypothetical protein